MSFSLCHNKATDKCTYSKKQNTKKTKRSRKLHIHTTLRIEKVFLTKDKRQTKINFDVLKCVIETVTVLLWNKESESNKEPEALGASAREPVIT